METGEAITNMTIHELNSIKVDKLLWKVNEHLAKWNIRRTDGSHQRVSFMLEEFHEVTFYFLLINTDPLNSNNIVNCMGRMSWFFLVF